MAKYFSFVIYLIHLTDLYCMKSDLLEFGCRCVDLEMVGDSLGCG